MGISPPRKTMTQCSEPAANPDLSSIIRAHTPILPHRHGGEGLTGVGDHRSELVHGGPDLATFTCQSCHTSQPAVLALPINLSRHTYMYGRESVQQGRAYCKGAAETFVKKGAFGRSSRLSCPGKLAGCPSLLC
jgi:hypothetical protein